MSLFLPTVLAKILHKKFITQNHRQNPVARQLDHWQKPVARPPAKPPAEPCGETL